MFACLSVLTWFRSLVWLGCQDHSGKADFPSGIKLQKPFKKTFRLDFFPLATIKKAPARDKQCSSRCAKPWPLLSIVNEQLCTLSTGKVLKSRAVFNQNSKTNVKMPAAIHKMMMWWGDEVHQALGSSNMPKELTWTWTAIGYSGVKIWSTPWMSNMRLKRQAGTKLAKKKLAGRYPATRMIMRLWDYIDCASAMMVLRSLQR